MALRLEQHAKIAVCLDVIWLKSQGMLKVAQKLGEEGVELALAAAAQDSAHVTAEAADLVYHLLLLLAMRELTLAEVVAELERRHRPTP